MQRGFELPLSIIYFLRLLKHLRQNDEVAFAVQTLTQQKPARVLPALC